MVTSIPLELLTAITKAEPYSPVIWDGSDLLVADDPLLNLRKIRADISALISKQLSFENSKSIITKQIDSLDTSLGKLKTKSALSKDLVDSLELKANKFENFVSKYNIWLTSLETNIISNDVSVTSANDIFDFIKSGNLVKSDDPSIEIKNNSIGEYIIIDSSTKTLTVLPGENIDVDYNVKSGKYSIVGTIPQLSSIIKSGNGIKLTQQQSGHIVISIKDGFINAIGGIAVRDVDNKFELSVNSDFITGDGKSVIVKRTNGVFFASLNTSYIESSAINYNGNNGIKYYNNKFTLDKEYITNISGGYGVKINKTIDSTGKTIFIPSFDEASLLDQGDVKINTQFPLKITAKGNSYEVSLSKSYVEYVNETNSALSNCLNRLEGSVKSLTWANTIKGTRLALANPIFKLFRLATGKFEESGLLAGGVTNSDFRVKLLKKYGPGTHTINVDYNLIPYIAYSEHGASNVINQTAEIDLFLPLQERLRQDLGISSFTINDSEKGSNYKILKINVDEFSYQINNKNSMPNISYNLGHKLDLMASQQWRSLYVGECKNFSYATGIYESTTYPGSTLMVTGGDCDYFSGKDRAGQLNGTPLAMPTSGFTSQIKVRITNAVKTYGDDYIAYNLTIQDDYSGGVYFSRFKRLTSQNIDPMKDYVFEQDGFSNPGWVRAVARLYTNWQLNDRDLNIILYTLGANNNCLANFGGEFFFGGVLKGNNSVITPEFIQNSGHFDDYNISIKLTNLNTVTGKANFILEIDTGEPNFSSVPITNVIRDLKFQIVYQVNNNIEGLFDKSKLFKDSCWGDFDEMFSLNCGTDDKETTSGFTQHEPTTSGPPTTTESNSRYVSINYVAPGYVI